MKKLLVLVSFAILACSCGTASKTQTENYLSEEAVNTGFGRVRRSELTGAVSTVDVQKLKEQTSYQSIYDYIKDTVPGVEVIGTGGTPEILIRGIRSINGSNEPLILLDGMEIHDLNMISPNDVDYITVLKDASMTAQYGSRGANGVILITTRKR